MKLTLMAVLATALAVDISASGAQKGTGYNKAVMCYFGSWSVYRPGNGKFDVEDIDPFACTHLVFGFAGLDAFTNEIIALDPYNELEENWGRGAFKRFTGLKKINPNLVTLLAIGGWNEGATKVRLHAWQLTNVSKTYSALFPIHSIPRWLRRPKGGPLLSRAQSTW